MVENPPTFKISNKCCKYAKKDVIHKCIAECGYDLNIYGVRKSEGGSRSTAYKSCFDEKPENYDNYRPLFWYSDMDKQDYEICFDVIHSACYTEYGLKRTGCIGCPFNRNIEYELEIMAKYEPKLYKAACNIFKESYEYTRKYREYVKRKNDLQNIQICKTCC